MSFCRQLISLKAAIDARVAASPRPRLRPCLLVLSALGATACAGTPAPRADASTAHGGVIESIESISPRQVSALTGMLMGGALGNNSCGTENRMVGLALGALGGAWAVGGAGDGVSDAGYRLTVRLDGGGSGYFDSRDPVRIHVGQRVYLSGHRLYELPVFAAADTSMRGR